MESTSAYWIPAISKQSRATDRGCAGCCLMCVFMVRMSFYFFTLRVVTCLPSVARRM